MKAIKLGSMVFLVSLVFSLSFVGAYQYYFKTEAYQIQSGLVLLGATITVPDDFLTIQEAINNAYDGDTIFVRNGTYHENVVVNKTVNLIGEDKNNTVIDGEDAYNTARIVADNAIMNGFTIQNGYYGLFVDSCVGVSIVENRIVDNSYGIRIELSDSTNVTGNIIQSNARGISHWYSSRSSLLRNQLVDNNIEGILVAYSSFLTLRENSLILNNWSIGVWGHGLSEFMHDIDTSNIIDGRPMYYLVNAEDVLIPTDAGYVGVVNSTHIQVSNLDLANNGQSILVAYSTNVNMLNITVSRNLVGIRLVHSSQCRVEDSVIHQNAHGIWLFKCRNNTITSSRVAECYSHGIVVLNSNSTRIEGNNIVENHQGVTIDGTVYGGGMYNSITHCNFINNTFQIWTSEPIPTDNVWDDACEGNYWSDYNGSDSDGDGIGDTPYIIDGINIDHYPLMNPYWLPGDINNDLFIDIFDAVLVATAYGCTSTDSEWNCHCDITEPYGEIDILDVVLMAGSYGEEY